MGELTRNFNWATTPLGTPDTWPQGLCTTLGILLHSAFPMFLFWGKTLTCFYNDAFRPSFGVNGKHPAVGKDGQEVWPEIWDFIGPLINRVMTEGEPVYFEDQLVPFYRNGQIENIYWTFSYSPAYGDEGTIEGVFVTCTETTKTLSGIRKLEESQQLFRSLIEKAPIATALFKGQELVIELANEIALDILGKGSSVFGKPLADVLPEIKSQPYLQHLHETFTSGKSFESKAIQVEIVVAGAHQKKFFDFTFKAIHDASGNIHGILAVAVDVTDNILAQQKVEETQQQLVASFQQSPVGLAVISSKQLTFTLANPFYGDLVGRQPEQLIGKPLLVAMPELEGQGFDKLLNEVLATGVPHVANEVAVQIFRNGALETIYVDFTYQPQKNGGQITDVLVVVVDVTQQVMSRKKVEESEMRFRSLIEEAPVATCLFVGPEMKVEVINARMVQAWGKDFSVKNKPLIEALPELEGQPFMDILADVYANGKTFEATAARVDLVVDGTLGTYYYDFTYKPLLDMEGKVYAIINVSINVTEQVIAKRKLEESEAKLQNIIYSAPIATCLFIGREMTIEIANEKILGFWGKGDKVIGKPLAEAVPELIGQPFLDILDSVYTTGITYEDKAAACDLEVDGELRTFYFDFTYKPMFDLSGNVFGVMDMAIDVTAEVTARKKLEEEEAAMRGAVELAGLATWSLDITTNTFHYSPRFMEWLGFAENTKGLDDAYNPLPEEYRQLVPSAIADVIADGSTGIYDYEHPIVNRLTGQVRIIHAQAHLFFDGLGNPIILRGTAQDVTQQRQIQLALEQQVQERTEELAAANEELQATNEELTSTNEELEEANNQLVHSNDELAQYAYVASHDLQEPLRKIRIFSSMLATHKGLAEESRPVLAKITQSAERMSLLIQNLLEFSRLLKSEALVQPIKLMDVLNAVVTDFELTIVEKGAVIEIGDLPTIEAVALQMNQLFFNLLSNSLKFIKPGVVPEISITCIPISNKEADQYLKKTSSFCNYYQIHFRDNGIGFESEYAEQIFEVFKRLHGRNVYPGSGIGLSLCRRIVVNHGGVLYSESEVGKGTSFFIILPDKQQG